MYLPVLEGLQAGVGAVVVHCGDKDTEGTSVSPLGRGHFLTKTRYAQQPVGSSAGIHSELAITGWDKL